MTNILHIDASAHLNGSTSRTASANLVVAQNAGSVVRRDLTADPLPQIDGAWADARMTDPATRSPEDAARLELSDQLVAELQAADTIVIGTPVYNFSAPAALKAWMDLVARPGVTFHYTSDGPEGLLKDKKVIVAVASGGTAIGSGYDFLTPHLAFFLGFLGITDVQFIAAKDVTAP